MPRGAEPNARCRWMPTDLRRESVPSMGSQSEPSNEPDEDSCASHPIQTPCWNRGGRSPERQVVMLQRQGSSQLQCI